MGKLSSLPPRGHAPTITTTPQATGVTHEGAPGYRYDDRSELYLLAVTNMVGEDTFYESAKARDDRYCQAVRRMAQADPTWLLGLIRWLRADAGMRSASVVAAVEAAHFTAGTERPRQFMAAGLGRADEPAEALGYWLAKYGRPLPTWLKRSLADAADRLYNPVSAFKYDGQNQPVRFADVIELADPRHLPASADRDALWQWLQDRRHGRASEVKIAVEEFRQILAADVHRAKADGRDVFEVVTPEALRRAAMTWEALPNLTGEPWSAAAWEAIIPSMGYMALLRNLRNFDQAGIAPSVARAVADKLADPEQVARSRQMPLRFLSAYRAVTNDRWKAPLGDALQASLRNVPALPGAGILVDASGSMTYPLSARSTLNRIDAAAVFGIALALASGVDEVQFFSTSQAYLPTPAGSSVLNLVERSRELPGMGGGTSTAAALKAAADRWGVRDSAVVLTDEQSQVESRSLYSGVPLALDALVRKGRRTYTFNLAGYQHSNRPATERHLTVGGLSDRAFDMIAAAEAAGRDGGWPWEA